MEIKKRDKKIIEEIQPHIEAIMNILKLERTPDNEKTPYRIAKMYATELFSTRNNRGIDELNNSMAVFEHEDLSEDVVIMKDVPLASTCSHHWLPFIGTCTVKYIPDKKIIGLSKIPRVIKYFSKRPQLQERLGKNIGDYLFDLIQPKTIIVEIKAKHTCVIARGAESDGETVTRYIRNKKVQ